MEEKKLLLVRTEERPLIPDQLNIVPADLPRFEKYHAGVTSHQERFSTRISPQGWLESVIYDGVEHLAGPLQISLNGEDAATSPLRGEYYPLGGLNVTLATQSLYETVLPIRVMQDTHYDLTACKSWVNVTHKISNTQPDMVVRFTLPLNTLSVNQTCDFGVGSGVYTKVTGEKTVWEVTFDKNPYALWRLYHVINDQKRIDYQGEAKTAKDFTGQSWFHWIDGVKSLAVALGSIPRGCRGLSVSFGHDGVVTIVYQFSHKPANPAIIGICYHFLNDIPAIAAATNPQSILLPPSVEVLPA